MKWKKEDTIREDAIPSIQPWGREFQVVDHSRNVVVVDYPVLWNHHQSFAVAAVAWKHLEAELLTKNIYSFKVKIFGGNTFGFENYRKIKKSQLHPTSKRLLLINISLRKYFVKNYRGEYSVQLHRSLMKVELQQIAVELPWKTVDWKVVCWWSCFAAWKGCSPSKWNQTEEASH